MKNTETLSKSKALRNARNMTDMLKGSQVLQKTYTYIENVTKESRKALMEDFSQNHKGIGINLAPDILRQTVLDWFPRRDPMLKRGDQIFLRHGLTIVHGAFFRFLVL